LVDVAHQEELGLGRQRLTQVIGQDNIEHRRLIYDNELVGQRPLGIVLELLAARHEIKQTVKC